jgi:quercetin dioxygenase-like cupin family protein
MSDQLIIKPTTSVASQDPENTTGTKIQVLLGPDDGMPNFFTRIFTVEPGGRIPVHRHNDIEHEQMMLEGELVIILESGEEKTVKAGDVVYFPPKVAHGYENRGSVPVKLVCIVPKTDHYQTEWL